MDTLDQLQVQLPLLFNTCERLFPPPLAFRDFSPSTLKESLKLPQIVGRLQGANARPVWWRVGMRVRFKFDTSSLGRRDLRRCTEAFRGHDKSRRDSDPVDLVAAFRNGDTV